MKMCCVVGRSCKERRGAHRPCCQGRGAAHTGAICIGGSRLKSERQSPFVIAGVATGRKSTTTMQCCSPPACWRPDQRSTTLVQANDRGQQPAAPTNPPASHARPTHGTPGLAERLHHSRLLTAHTHATGVRAHVAAALKGQPANHTPEPSAARDRFSRPSPANRHVPSPRKACGASAGRGRRALPQARQARRGGAGCPHRCGPAVQFRGSSRFKQRCAGSMRLCVGAAVRTLSYRRHFLGAGSSASPRASLEASLSSSASGGAAQVRAALLTRVFLLAAPPPWLPWLRPAHSRPAPPD